ncbi:hypothetical protein [Paenibacillus sp. M2]|uniref:hypothetical protein n=1 Tax=Paenibacillus sp. M2 TaxID=3341793 RepID=UPI003989307A
MVIMTVISLIGLFTVFLIGIFGMNEAKTGQGILYNDRFQHQTNVLELKSDFYNIRANYTKVLNHMQSIPTNSTIKFRKVRRVSRMA